MRARPHRASTRGVDAFKWKEITLKKVEAVVRPEMLLPVRKALEELGVNGLTITQVLGHGAQRGVTQQWKGNSYKVDLLPKVELKMIIGDHQLEPVLDVIRESACTGAVGDGKVFVSTIEEVMRVRTGERGEAAV
jgi:nitrogen regulatory protein P-II 1